jgi:uncharacterized protein (DUF427 family)
MARGHQITVTPTDLHVEVAVGGHTVAKSDRPVLLEETGLPARYYLPREDVRTDLLRRTDRTTSCPFKGEASYWSVVVGGEVYDDLVWSYEGSSTGPIRASPSRAGSTTTTEAAACTSKTRTAVFSR